VAPHSSFLDAFAIFWTGLPFIVNREENRNLLFVGKCIQFAQAIFVSR
jgi:1-acyl-sn-glycerol-3-phosphate acyltransferase